MNVTVAEDFLKAVRLSELAQVVSILQRTVPAGAKILEIGAGAGWQARELAANGYEVSAIDIPTSNHGGARIWPVIDFDGQFIPFPDKSFDIVYSSNVLEHVEDMKTLNAEIVRVLRTRGTAIHYVPTSAWRAWSLAAFYPALLRDVLRRARRKLLASRVRQETKAAAPAVSAAPASSSEKRSLLAKILRRAVPHAHGAAGSCFSELSRFSRRSWDNFFAAQGWAVLSYARNGMFLTGDMILGPRLSTDRRKRMSRWFGCTAHLYVLKRQPGR